MSAYPKLLWNITVPTGGWDFAFTDPVARTVTVPAGTYENILDLADELEIQLDASPSALLFDLTVSSIGMVVIAASGAWNVNWAGTTNALSTALGYDETEAVVDRSLIATNAHLYGWYPGLLTYGRTTDKGAGLTVVPTPKPTWPVNQAVAGSGSMRTIGPVTPSEDIPFELSLIGWTEYNDADRGVRAWWDGCVAAQFYFFPDRYVGTVDTWNAGTLVQDTDYYLCTIYGEVKDREGPNPRFCYLAATFHVEP